MPEQREAGCNSGILEFWKPGARTVSTALPPVRDLLMDFFLMVQGSPRGPQEALYRATTKSNHENEGSKGHLVIRIKSQWAFDFLPQGPVVGASQHPTFLSHPLALAPHGMRVVNSKLTCRLQVTSVQYNKHVLRLPSVCRARRLTNENETVEVYAQSPLVLLHFS